MSSTGRKAAADPIAGPGVVQRATLVLLAGAAMPVAVIAPLGLVPVMAAAALVLALAAFMQGARLDRAALTPPVVAVLALIGWALASSLWSDRPGSSADGALRLLLLAFAGWALLAGVRCAPPPAGRTFAYAMAAGAFFAAVALMIDYFSADVVLTRALYDWKGAVPLSANAKSQLNRGAILLVLLVWPLALALARCHGRRAGWAAVALTGLVVFAGDSTAARAALVAGALVYALACISTRTAFRTLRIGLAVAVLGFPWLIALMPPPENALYEPLAPSAHHRVTIWTFTAERIEERPFAGWGMNASRWIPGGSDVQVFKMRNAKGGFFDNELQNLPLHPHNAALQWWLELGAGGAVLAVIALWTLLGAIERALAGRTNAATAAAAAFAGASVIAFVSFGIWQNWWLAALVVVAALLAVAQRIEPAGGASAARP
jgi:O-antigen ligase